MLITVEEETNGTAELYIYEPVIESGSLLENDPNDESQGKDWKGYFIQTGFSSLLYRGYVDYVPHFSAVVQVSMWTL